VIFLRIFQLVIEYQHLFFLLAVNTYGKHPYLTLEFFDPFYLFLKLLHFICFFLEQIEFLWLINGRRL
jgi:hypothetical protein